MTKNGIWNGNECKSATEWTRCIDIECIVKEESKRRCLLSFILILDTNVMFDGKYNVNM